MKERHLSLVEACEELDISERTAYRWIKSGKLKAYKPGRDYRIPESAIKEAVEGSLVRPKVKAPPSLTEWLEERCGHAYLALSKTGLEELFDAAHDAEVPKDRAQTLMAQITEELLSVNRSSLSRKVKKDAANKWAIAMVESAAFIGADERFQKSLADGLTEVAGRVGA